MLLINLKSKLNTLLWYKVNQRVIKLEYRSSSIDNEEKIRFTMFELKTDDDLKIMWSNFYRYPQKIWLKWTQRW